jgi:predicted short-subunit dehydrogenase-like oxidoreductase (DUF2520 family)
MIGIIGGGRMGRGLALVLGEAGERVELWSRREAGSPAGMVEAAHTVILAVPDDAIGLVAGTLQPNVTSGHVVLHLSGLHDRSVLLPLETTGAALGSFHPLQTIPDPALAAERWRGAYAAVEGDERAVAEGERLAGLLGLRAVRLPSGAKPLYHAAAVAASNYVVALAGIAARLAVQAGVPPAQATELYRPLLLGAAMNLQHQRPEEALTGPVRRGDLATLRIHLARLQPADRRWYVALALETLALARAAGLAPERADEVERLLRGEEGGKVPVW